ncbi:hypothetical protein [Pseudomonas paraveronii]|nr:hypothetical protein [Pseudomonas sp. FLM 11]
MIDHMLLHSIVNGQLGYPGFQAGDVMRSDRFWPRLCKNVFQRDRYSKPD